MMLITGPLNSLLKNQRGFTLIEVMAAVIVLAPGTVVIQEGFLRSASLFNRGANLLTAQIWMDEKLWRAKEAVLYSEKVGLGSSSGRFVESDRIFEWALSNGLSSVGKELYSLELSVNWKEGNRPVRVKRMAYVTKPTPTA